MISDARLCQLCVESYTEPLTFESGGAHLRLTKEDEFTVAAFRGTASIYDWARNFIFTKLGKVHLGFATSANLAWPRIPTDRPLIITGHSAGGAIAQLVASWLVAGGRPPVKLTTFGTPRVESLVRNRGTVTDLLKYVPGIDYRNGLDPVPDFPIEYGHPRDVAQLGEKIFGAHILEDHYIERYASALAL